MGRKIAVIGGGPSGMMAAIQAAKQNPENRVILLEKNDTPGKKLLLTGNGKCNYSNTNMDSSHYNENAKEITKQVLKEFTPEDLRLFFAENGMLSSNKSGLLYPYSGQARTVLNTLMLLLIDFHVTIVSNANVYGLQTIKDGDFDKYIVEYEEKTSLLSEPAIGKCKEAKNKRKEAVFVEKGNTKIHKERFDSVILCCGGKAYPKTGSDGSGFKLARNLGIFVSNTYPVLVKLNSDFNKSKKLSGIRTKAKVSAVLYDKSGQPEILSDALGELQIVDSGISGINVFQVSRALSKPLEEHQKCEVWIDYLPDFDGESIYEFIEQSKILNQTHTLQQFFGGILCEKLTEFYLKRFFDNPHMPVSSYPKEQLIQFMMELKCIKIPIQSHNGYNEAQATRGGVSCLEINSHLESVLHKNLYFAGEMVDVDGECGGYNLHWAFASGYVAGTHCGSERKE